ncbi:LOW QUALITY PROTEIN: proteasome subunit beta type-4 [Alligator sinensis]|uniref:Proteasome subunit beta type-4 n=1 Tax=Alligator sinensis TaxID=38654 RepID=A0A3Q0FQ45_ALLSI|nr:LOW QUALITY PROTEIN: proteasome subunit beta type-4 [Alligator sinensis]
MAARAETQEARHTQDGCPRRGAGSHFPRKRHAQDGGAPGRCPAGARRRRRMRVVELGRAAVTKMEAAGMVSVPWAGGRAPGQLCALRAGPGPGLQLDLDLQAGGGEVVAADTLGSYGSLARFRNISRIMKVNDNTVLGASGDYADFQYLKQVIDQMVIDEELLGDGHNYSPKAIHSWLTRAMYSRRCKMNPLWNTVVIGGFYNGESFLGYVDMLGVAYEAPTLATGYGAYLAQPLMREALEKKPILTKEEAQDLIERCMKILYYRDARSFNRFQIAVVTEKGVEVEEPRSVETNWDIAHLIRGFE